MASITAIISCLIMACTVLAQMMPINVGCAESSPSVKTLTYTEWMAPQIPPTSTVYRMIVTHYDNIVWCSNGAATVTNVQANTAVTGTFTEQVVSPVLTIQAVGCLPTDMVLTRRKVRGEDYVKRSVHKKDIEAPATTSSVHPKPTYSPKKHYLDRVPFPIPKGWTHNDAIEQVGATHQKKTKRQALPSTLSPEAAALVSQLQTAEYALELCNSDFNLTEICQELRDPTAIVPLANVGVSASQAGDIVCFASVYGIDLNTTNAELLGDLAAAVYGLELGDNFTTTTNTTNLCGNVNLAAAPYLGINAGAVSNFICGGPSTSVTITAVTTQTVVVIPGSPTVTFTPSGTGSNNGIPGTTFTASGVGVSGGLPWQSGMATGNPNVYPNGTSPYSTAGGSAVSGAAAPSGAGVPSGNSTGTDSLGIDFPQSSDAPQGGNQRIPVAPNAPQYYPVDTLETVTPTYGRYN